MDWRDWELFCEVVQHGGFSAAARVLGHPKSTLSAAVQRLESNLGLRLIEALTALRHTNGAPGATIYGPCSWDRRGATIAFNFLHPDGRVVDEETMHRLRHEEDQRLIRPRERVTP